MIQIKTQATSVKITARVMAWGRDKQTSSNCASAQQTTMPPKMDMMSQKWVKIKRMKRTRR